MCVWSGYGAGEGEGDTALQPAQRHGAQGLWLWHLPAGKAVVGAEEEEQYSVKHHQVAKVPRGSNALGWAKQKGCFAQSLCLAGS